MRIVDVAGLPHAGGVFLHNADEDRYPRAPPVPDTPQRTGARNPARNKRTPSDASPQPKPETNGADLAEAVRDWKTSWLRNILIKRVKGFDLDELLHTAELLAIDPSDHWKMERSFLDLFQGQPLRDLAAELKTNISAAANEEEIRAVLRFANPEQVPLIVAEV